MRGKLLAVVLLLTAGTGLCAGVPTDDERANLLGVDDGAGGARVHLRVPRGTEPARFYKVEVSTEAGDFRGNH